jgi:hypothetical protein
MNYLRLIKFKLIINKNDRGLKMETICVSEVLVSDYESTRRHNREQHRF